MTLRQISDVLATLTYPIRTEEFLSAIGHREIEYPTGKRETIAEIYARTDDADEWLTHDDAALSIECGVAADAVGRQGYSDRDPPIQGVDNYQQASF